jgi:hypothetical protein
MNIRHTRWSTVALSLGLLGTLSAQASYTAYDNFSGAFIVPQLWQGQETGGAVREALRLVVADPLVTGNKRLLLFNLAYGGFASNAGTSSGTLALNVTDPGSVGGIRATVEAGNLWPGACATNTDATTTMAGIGGAFFNPNPMAPSATGDVWATLGLERRSDATGAANVVAVVARLSQCSDAKCERRATLAEQTLGTAATTQRIILAVEWDRPNRQFLFQRGATTVALPYSIADVLAPVVHAKGLLTMNAAANCEAPGIGVALMEAYFDDVLTKPMPALPPVFPPDQYEPNETAGAARFLGTVPDGGSVVHEATIHTTEDRDWFRIQATEQTAPSCFPGQVQNYRTTIRLTGIPPGRDYDLQVRVGTPSGTPFSSANAGDADESIAVPWSGNCAAHDTMDFFIEVRYVSGLPTDAKYQLITSHARTIVLGQEPDSFSSSRFVAPSSSVNRVAVFAARPSHSGSVHSISSSDSTAMAK